MQRYFKNQKMLIGVIGLAILGTANVQAVSSFDSPAKIQPSIGNVPEGLDMPASIARTGVVEPMGGDGVSPSVMFVSLDSRHAMAGSGRIRAGVLDGRFVGSRNSDKLLSPAETYLYSDALNMAVADVVMATGKDGSAKLVPSHSDAGLSGMFPIRAADANPKLSPVPLPAAVWSFLLGLLGILGLKKRRQAPAETI
jgi:hypothetical protein